MRMRTTRRGLAGACAVALSLACGGEEGRSESGAEAGGAEENPRFGVWELQSDQPPPWSNVMTYEPYGDGGMKITVASTSSEGVESEWSYTTLFDGAFRPVSGQENATTAVEVVDDRVNLIRNARGGEVYQTITNVLTANNDTIHNEYRRVLEDGSERVSHATYVRIRE